MSYLDWKVDDKIVGIEEPMDRGWGYERPKQGRIYTIRQIGVGRDGNVGVKLVEIVNEKRDYPSVYGGISYGEVSFVASSFRRVEPRKTSIAIFERFLTDTKAPIIKERVS